IGRSSSGSIRAKRASMCASSLSSFRVLWLISLICRALATITSCPHPLSNRLIQGECVPTSSAIRQRPKAPHNCVIPFLVLGTLRSNSTLPSWSIAQQRLVLSPRSMPIVTDPWQVFVDFLPSLELCRAVLFFFISRSPLHFECVSI